MKPPRLWQVQCYSHKHEKVSPFAGLYLMVAFANLAPWVKKSIYDWLPLLWPRTIISPLLLLCEWAHLYDHSSTARTFPPRRSLQASVWRDFHLAFGKTPWVRVLVLPPVGHGLRFSIPFGFLLSQGPGGQSPLGEPWVRTMDLMLHPVVNTRPDTNGFWTSLLPTSSSAEKALRRFTCVRNAHPPTTSTRHSLTDKFLSETRPCLIGV